MVSRWEIQVKWMKMSNVLLFSAMFNSQKHEKIWNALFCVKLEHEHCWRLIEFKLKKKQSCYQLEFSTVWILMEFKWNSLREFW